MMAILVQLLSLCFKLLKKVRQFSIFHSPFKNEFKGQCKRKSLFNFINFESKEEINYVNSFQLQMENNRWVSVTNKDSVDGKT